MHCPLTALRGSALHTAKPLQGNWIFLQYTKLHTKILSISILRFIT